MFFDFFEARLNDVPFYLLSCKGTLDCLDREHSILVPFPHDPSRIMDIKQFRFHKERLVDPLFFAIPESWNGLFATPSVERLIRQRGLRGFVFSDAEQDE